MTTWREATVEDYPGILACHHQLERKLGVELDIPKFDDREVLAWRVAVRDGEIVQFAILAGVIEFRMGGCDREALQALMEQEAEQIKHDTRQVGARFIHVCVPPAVEKQTARKLKKVGVTKSPNALYSIDLREQTS